MVWEPDQAQLRLLAGFLKDSLNGRDPNAQKNATLVSVTTVPVGMQPD